MENLTLIGTYHNSVDGSVDLEKVLRDLRPAIVVVEGTEDKVKGEEKARNMLYNLLKGKGYDSDHANLWCDTVVQGYEQRVALKYCNDHGASFNYMDDKGRVITEQERRKNLSLFVDFIQKNNIDELKKKVGARHTHDLKIIESYVGEAYESELISDLIPDYYDTIGTIREQQMKNKVLKIIRENPDKIITAIVGNNHIFKDPRGLSFYSILDEPRPRRIFI